MLVISAACLSSNSSRYGSNSRTSVVAQVQKFYKDVRQKQQLELEQNKPIGEDTSPPSPVAIIHGLLATLRGYQTRALAWMLQRECVAGSGGCVGDKETCELHVLWRKLPVNRRMQQVYFNPYTARLARAAMSCNYNVKGEKTHVNVCIATEQLQLLLL